MNAAVTMDRGAAPVRRETKALAMRRRRAPWRMGPAGVAVLAVTGPAAAGDLPDSSDPFRQLNDTAITIYQQAKSRYLAAADPVVIVGASSILIRQHGAVRGGGALPPPVHFLKTVG